MRQTLQISLGQHLAMTPRLQQAIRLLQLSTTELQTEIQEALDSNFMLEPDEEETASDSAEPSVVPVDIPGDLPVDSVWDDIYDPLPAGSHSSAGEEIDFVDQRAQSESLRDRLYWQLSMMRFSVTDQIIGAAIVDAVDDDGYLGVPLDDIRRSVSSSHREVDVDEVEAVLRQVQNFDPPGVAARDPGECLAIQLRHLPDDTEWRDVAFRVVTEHLQLLASKQYTELMKTVALEKHELQCVINLIRSLAPRPGSAVESSAPEYVVPDVYVRKHDGAWNVELNTDALPRLRINSSYTNLIRRADGSAENSTLKHHLQEARWFIKSLRNRSETLLKTATCIAERQRAFLEHGEEAMKPMVLADVAEAIGMHESTVSRVTTRKFMHTPRGTFELKYFFSSHVHTASGSEASSTAIRAVLRKLIEAENPARPLSDHKLAATLSNQGIRIARRTIAKYREAMAIPSSTERRAL